MALLAIMRLIIVLVPSLDQALANESRRQEAMGPPRLLLPILNHYLRILVLSLLNS